jgi:hypothetical protein
VGGAGEMGGWGGWVKAAKEAKEAKEMMRGLGALCQWKAKVRPPTHTGASGERTGR